MFLVFIVFSSVYSAYQVLFVSDVFKIDTVEISGPFRYVSKSDLEEVAEGLLFGKNLLLLKDADVVDPLSNSFLAIRQLEVEKRLPHILRISVAEREPSVVVVQDDSFGGDSFVVDEDGFVLGKVADASFDDLPKIYYMGDVFVGSFLEDDVVGMGLRVLAEALPLDLDVELLKFYDRYYEVYLKSDVVVLINKEKDVGGSLKVASALIENMSLDGKTVSKIDMRYDKVVVSY